MTTKYTLQSAFDTIVRGIAAQNYVPALATGDACVYRGDEGRKCAFGHLIPNPRYTPAMECGTARDLLYAFPDLWDLFDTSITTREVWLIFFTGVQSAHDRFLKREGASTVAGPQAWLDVMRLIAAAHSVSTFRISDAEVGLSK